MSHPADLCHDVLEIVDGDFVSQDRMAYRDALLMIVARAQLDKQNERTRAASLCYQYHWPKTQMPGLSLFYSKGRCLVERAPFPEGIGIGR